MMAGLRKGLFGSRFRLGNAVGLLLVQDQAAAKSNSGAFQKQSVQGLKDAVMSTMSPNVSKTRIARKCPCRISSPREPGPSSLKLGSHELWRRPEIKPEFGSWASLSQVKHIRNYSTDPKRQATAEDGEPSPEEQAIIKEKSKELEEEQKPVGIFQKFKNASKEYGKVLVCVHVATSAVWFGSFYYAACTGVDIVPVLKTLGFSDTLIKPFTMPGVGNAAVAYLIYKLATPARYTVTIAGTQLTVRQLRRLGYMKPVPEGHSIRDLAKESASQMKERYGDLKDDVKDKYSDMKDDVKDKYSDLRDDFKTKIEDWKTGPKDKSEDVSKK